jgi:hypothetical protein
MSKDLVARIRKSRQISVPVKHYTIICRRPTMSEMSSMASNKLTEQEMLKRFVDGWEDMQEKDIILGGTDELVPFTRELFEEWVVDHPEAWGPIAKAIVEAYKRYEADLEEAAKN